MGRERDRERERRVICQVQHADRRVIRECSPAHTNIAKTGKGVLHVWVGCVRGGHSRCSLFTLAKDEKFPDGRTDGTRGEHLRKLTSILVVNVSSFGGLVSFKCGCNLRRKSHNIQSSYAHTYIYRENTPVKGKYTPRIRQAEISTSHLRESIIARQRVRVQLRRRYWHNPGHYSWGNLWKRHLHTIGVPNRNTYPFCGGRWR